MNEADIRSVLKSFLLLRFHVDPQDFEWNKPLQDLHENFKILGYLMFLEQLLNEHLQADLPLIENIDVSIHTPEDVIKLVRQELNV